MALRLKKDGRYLDRRTRPTETCKTERLAFRIPVGLADQLEREGQRRGWDRSRIVRNILVEYFRPGTSEL